MTKDPNLGFFYFSLFCEVCVGCGDGREGGGAEVRGIGSMVGWRIPPPGIYQWGKGGGGAEGYWQHGWVANSTPWYLPVAFTSIYLSGKYSSSGKYWQIDFFFFFFALKYSRNLKTV